MHSIFIKQKRIEPQRKRKKMLITLQRKSTPNIIVNHLNNWFVIAFVCVYLCVNRICIWSTLRIMNQPHVGICAWSMYYWQDYKRLCASTNTTRHTWVVEMKYKISTEKINCILKISTNINLDTSKLAVILLAFLFVIFLYVM